MTRLLALMSVNSCVSYVDLNVGFGQKRNTFQALGSLQNSNSRQFEENFQQSLLLMYTDNPYMHQSSWSFDIVALCTTQTLKANASVQ
jgi:hypothetical protein